MQTAREPVPRLFHFVIALLLD